VESRFWAALARLSALIRPANAAAIRERTEFLLDRRRQRLLGHHPALQVVDLDHPRAHPPPPRLLRGPRQHGEGRGGRLAAVRGGPGGRGAAARRHPGDGDAAVPRRHRRGPDPDVSGRQRLARRDRADRALHAAPVWRDRRPDRRPARGLGGRVLGPGTTTASSAATRTRTGWSPP
jgi:hypothetical protein